MAIPPSTAGCGGGTRVPPSTDGTFGNCRGPSGGGSGGAELKHGRWCVPGSCSCGGWGTASPMYVGKPSTGAGRSPPVVAAAFGASAAADVADAAAAPESVTREERRFHMLEPCLARCRL